MRTLQLMVPVSALLLIIGCSTTQQRSEEQSILEVVDSSKATGVPVQRGCAVGEVNYCLSSPAGTQECACVDSRELWRATEHMFPR